MPRITICLDQRTAELMDSAAKASGLSRSQWIGEAVRMRVRKEWSASIRALAGAWPDFPDGSDIRRLEGQNIPRKRL